jgi:hypothetical protein
MRPDHVFAATFSPALALRVNAGGFKEYYTRTFT